MAIRRLLIATFVAGAVAMSGIFAPPTFAQSAAASADVGDFDSGGNTMSVVGGVGSPAPTPGNSEASPPPSAQPPQPQAAESPAAMPPPVAAAPPAETAPAPSAAAEASPMAAPSVAAQASPAAAPSAAEEASAPVPAGPPVTEGDAERQAASMSTPAPAPIATPAAAAAASPAAAPAATPALTASVPPGSTGAAAMSAPVAVPGPLPAPPPSSASPAAAAAAPTAPKSAPAAAVAAGLPSAAAGARAAKKAGKKTEVASVEPANQSPFAGLQFSSGSSPIDIKSDSLSLDYKDKSVLFTGHVRATQATGQLTSKELRVNYGKNFHDVTEMIANGNVRISQGERWATGQHAVMNQQNHTVVLTGSPVVHDGPDEITGDRITVYLETGRSVVDHARAVIFPKGSRSAEGGNSAVSQ